MKKRTPSAALAAALLAGVVALAGCSQEPINSPDIAGLDAPSFAIVQQPTEDRTVGHNKFIVCKDGSAAIINVTFKFLDGRESTADLEFPTPFGKPCIKVGEDEMFKFPVEIWVEEIGVPDGFVFDRIMVTTYDDGVILGPTAVFDNPWHGIGESDNGFVLEFKNVPDGDFEGCTPGAWKNRLLEHKGVSQWPPTGLSPDQTVGSLFSEAPASLADVTLLEALEFSGGPDLVDKIALLIHHAVAAALNAGHPDINYPYGQAEVVNLTNAAILTADAGTILAQKDDFDGANNAGCFGD